MNRKAPPNSESTGNRGPKIPFPGILRKEEEEKSHPLRPNSEGPKEKQKAKGGALSPPRHQKGKIRGAPVRSWWLTRAPDKCPPARKGGPAPKNGGKVIRGQGKRGPQTRNRRIADFAPSLPPKIFFTGLPTAYIWHGGEIVGGKGLETPLFHPPEGVWGKEKKPPPFIEIQEFFSRPTKGTKNLG